MTDKALTPDEVHELLMNNRALDCELSGCRLELGICVCDYCGKYSCLAHHKVHVMYHELALHKLPDKPNEPWFMPERADEYVSINCPDCHRIGGRPKRTVYFCTGCQQYICKACTEKHKLFEELKGIGGVG